MGRLCFLLLLATWLSSTTAPAGAAPAVETPHAPSARGYLIVTHREIKACADAQGKVSIIGHMRYCSKPFKQDRREDLKD
jgi:hypothetical protein